MIELHHHTTLSSEKSPYLCSRAKIEFGVRKIYITGNKYFSED